MNLKFFSPDENVSKTKKYKIRMLMLREAIGLLVLEGVFESEGSARASLRKKAIQQLK